MLLSARQTSRRLSASKTPLSLIHEKTFAKTFEIPHGCGCNSVFKSMINLKSERKNLKEFIAFRNSWCFCWHKTQARVMPFWEETIAPALKSGKTVFVAAHGNSIRAILKFLEGISDNDITGRMIGWLKNLQMFLLGKSDWRFFGGLEIPTGRPLMYKLDKDCRDVD